MTGTNLFDCLAEQLKLKIVDIQESETLRALAEQMIDSAIASVKTLRPLRSRMFPLNPTAENLIVAKALRTEFEQWVADAEAVYQRVHALGSTGIDVSRLSELNDLIGLTQAMLSITLDDHLKSLHEECKPWSIEEARRELHLQRRG